jgi:DtxR family Mn-dependent transcriptional regulator
LDRRNYKEQFHTFRGYTLAQFERDDLSASMEDYLEMIYRLSRGAGHTRVNDLAQALNVQPPSVTKMIQRLDAKGLLRYEKYGVIMLTESGQEMGHYLLERHNMLEEFLRIIGVRQRLLENVERIEHNLTPEATQCLFNLVELLRQYPDLQAQLARRCQQLPRP